MPRKRMTDSQAAFEEALKKLGQERYILCLYVTGATPNSTRAITNITAFCEKYLKDRYELEIIDMYQQPELAKKDQILGVPTLIKRAPPPVRRLIGDLSNIDRFLSVLGLY